MSQPSKLGEARIVVRIDMKKKSVIARAAKLQQTTIEDFMLGHAYIAAINILSEITGMTLTGAQWEKFLTTPIVVFDEKTGKPMKTITLEE